MPVVGAQFRGALLGQQGLRVGLSKAWTGHPEQGKGCDVAKEGPLAQADSHYFLPAGLISVASSSRHFGGKSSS